MKKVTLELFNSDASNKILSVKNIKYSINSNEIIKGISLDLSPQECLVVLGLAGSGKSTFLKLITGLLIPTEGSITILGEDVHKLRGHDKMVFFKENIGFVFQDGALLSSSNVFENIALSLRYHQKHKEKVIKEKVDKLLIDLGIDDIANKMPAVISLGQSKLVGFARTFITEPKIIFLDEPESSLDMESTNIIIEKIRNFIIAGGTIVSISHNMFYTNALASKMSIIQKGEIIEYGTPHSVKTSSNPMVKKIIKSISQEADLADELLKLMKASQS